MTNITYNKNSDHHENWFFFTVLYIVIDYARPQDILSIGFLKPAMIMSLILLWFLTSGGQIRNADSKQTRMVLSFIALLALYIPFATNNYFAYLATKDMLLYMPFFLSTIISVNSIERLKKMIFILILIMIYVAIYSLRHGGVGSGNYFMDENDLSLYLNMYLPFCFFLFSVENEKFKKIIYGIGLILGLSAIVVSSSRGGFVGLVCSAMVVFIYSSKKLNTLTIISLICMILYFFAGSAYWADMNSISNTDDRTAVIRLESWKSGWKMFLDNPFGVGGNNFQVRFSEYQTEFFQRGMWGRVAHSLWFTLFPELGIIGIIIYISLLYYNIKDIIFLRRLNDYANNSDCRYLYALSAAFIASIVGYFASGTFISVLYYPHYWYLIGIIVATVKIGNDIIKAETVKDIHKA